MTRAQLPTASQQPTRLIWLALFALVLVSASQSPQNLTPISGRVDGLHGNDHVLIKAEGRKTYSATTRAGGRWTLAEVVPGTYTITPYHARYDFEPRHREVTVKSQKLQRVDFTATLKN